MNFIEYLQYNIKHWIRNKIIKLGLFVNVGIEGINSPWEFIVTEHAKKRLQERAYIRDMEKMKLDVYNAWNIGRMPAERVMKKLKQAGLTKKYEYRIYDRCLYVFAIRGRGDYENKWGYTQKVLVTMCPKFNW